MSSPERMSVASGDPLDISRVSLGLSQNLLVLRTCVLQPSCESHGIQQMLPGQRNTWGLLVSTPGGRHIIFAMKVYESSGKDRLLQVLKSRILEYAPTCP